MSTTGEAPAPRWGHSTSVVDDTLYVFGGYGQSLYNELYALDLSLYISNV